MADGRARDHLRVCGEHSASAVSVSAAQGSSPRMRGAPRAVHARAGRAGIIPAYAGSTAPSTLSLFWSRDHPRVCGEHATAKCTSCSRPGSSPRMRGAPRHAPVASDAVGIIPAYAGSTAPSFLKVSQYRDHPRVCGEHSSESLRQRSQAGSSPRMRGALGAALSVTFSRGIIPAYAGSTWHPPSSAFPCWDHPRVCGEHSRWAATRCARRGSSPRMRGAPPREGGGVPGRGIIPAYAGSTGRPA